MFKLKNKFVVLHKSFAVRCFLVTMLICVIGVGVIRPIVGELAYNEAAPTSAAKKKLPIYCVDTPEKKVAISFDAAWGAEDTDNLLKILEENDAKATFFLCGYWVDKYPDEVKRIFEAGHTIGNHSNTHPHGNQLGLQKNKDEIMAVHQKVKDLLGVEMNLYRPPYSNRVY